MSVRQANHFCFKITEPLLECVPQVHILLCVFLQNPEVVTDGNELFFLATFGTSVLSASMGITNFLMQGRCSLLPQKGFLGGTGRVGYIMLLFNVCLTLVGKGIILGSGVNPDLAKKYASKLVSCFTIHF